jgi:hypothetical protein
MNLKAQKLILTACLLGMMAISNSAVSRDDVEGLGNLFTDLEQREKLEEVRHGTYRKEVEKNSRVSNVIVDGVMLRSDGTNVIWINGKNTLDRKSVEGVSAYPESADKESFSVPVRIDNKRLKLKPGQVWSEGTGQVRDNY